MLIIPRMTHICAMLEIQNVKHFVMVKEKLFYLQDNKYCK